MHKARSTCAAAMATRISGKRAASSGKVRWQWESTNMGRLQWRGQRACAGSYENCSDSDGLGRALGRQVAAQDLFDLDLEQPRLFVRRKADTDALGAIGGGASGRHPGHLAGDRVAL